MLPPTGPPSGQGRVPGHACPSRATTDAFLSSTKPIDGVGLGSGLPTFLGTARQGHPQPIWRYTTLPARQPIILSYATAAFVITRD
jgi:hypothetical protein